jgi:tetratricopeptide (TPR) repeat protein
MKTALGKICVAALVAAACFGAAGAAHAAPPRLAPLQSDSACSAPMPGWQAKDYIPGCAQLITRLEDIRTRCAKVGLPPSVPVDSADPQGLCTETNLNLVKSQLAAAHNDRAYFLILCRGSENYRLAIEDLDLATELLPKYWLAFRNRAVANMLLGNFEAAHTDFTAIARAASVTDPGDVLVQTVSQADFRLGLGYANLGMCVIGDAQDQLFEAERLALGPVGADIWLRAAALFGQGLGLKAKGAALSRIAATNTAITPSDRGRYEREAARTTGQGNAKMQAARALVPTIDADVRDRFYIEESFIVNKCRANTKTV